MQKLYKISEMKEAVSASVPVSFSSDFLALHIGWVSNHPAMYDYDIL